MKPVFNKLSPELTVSENLIFQSRTVLSSPPEARNGQRNFAQWTSASWPDNSILCPIFARSDKSQTDKSKLASFWVTSRRPRRSVARPSAHSSGPFNFCTLPMDRRSF